VCCVSESGLGMIEVVPMNHVGPACGGQTGELVCRNGRHTPRSVWPTELASLSPRETQCGGPRERMPKRNRNDRDRTPEGQPPFDSSFGHSRLAPAFVVATRLRHTHTSTHNGAVTQVSNSTPANTAPVGWMRRCKSVPLHLMIQSPIRDSVARTVTNRHPVTIN
jgi:hypothetical protein